MYYVLRGPHSGVEHLCYNSCNSEDLGWKYRQIIDEDPSDLTFNAYCEVRIERFYSSSSLRALLSIVTHNGYEDKKAE